MIGSKSLNEKNVNQTAEKVSKPTTKLILVFDSRGGKKHMWF